MRCSHARVLVAGSLLILSLAGCGGGNAQVSTAGRASATPSPTPGTGWIVGATTLKDLLARDRDGVVAATLDQPSTYVVVTAKAGAPAGWTVTPTESFTDANALVDAVDGATLVSGVRAVLLDLEAWKFTPPDQQKDPGGAYAKAVSAAHGRGLKLVATPALDLVNGDGRRPGETAAQAYIRLRLPEQTGRDADVFEVQSQSVQNQPAVFAGLLDAAATQVHGVNPRAIVFGGVSTNPAGQQSSAAQMLDAVHAAGGTVEGYWLNDPGQGSFCTTCRGPFPAIAVQFLRDMRG